MVTPKTIPAGDAVGLLDDGSINVGTEEQMRVKFEEARAESDAADAAVAEAFQEQEDFADLIP